MQWIEAILNVSAFAAFIGIANAWPEHRESAEGGNTRDKSGARFN